MIVDIVVELFSSFHRIAPKLPWDYTVISAVPTGGTWGGLNAQSQREITVRLTNLKRS